jgi:hypothetical protein
MDSETIAAIVTGVTGILGVVVGSFFAAFQTWWINWSKTNKDTAYLAVVVVAHLI